MPFWLVECVLALEHGFNNFFVGLAIEWRVAAEQDVEDDTAAPKIALLVVALAEDLRRNVVGRPVLLGHLLARDEGSGRAEVDNSNACLISRPVEKQVFRLQVAMHDILTMAVVYRGEDLLDHVRGILLAKYLLLRDALEKLPSVAQPRLKKRSLGGSGRVMTCTGQALFKSGSGQVLLQKLTL